MGALREAGLFADSNLKEAVTLKKQVEEKFEKYFGYLARCEENFRTTTLKISKKSHQNQPKCKQNAVKI